MCDQFLKGNSSSGDIGGLPIKLHAAGQAAFEPGDLSPPHLKRDSLVVCGDAQDVCKRGAHGVRALIAGYCQQAGEGRFLQDRVRGESRREDS